MIFTVQETSISKKKKVRFKPFLILFGFLTLAIIASGLSFYFRWAKAASFSLYPGSCLGSWRNSNLAQGQPDTSDINLINKDNAAVFSEGGIKEIYCGSFNGDLSESEIKLIKSVNLKFSWLVIDEELKVPTLTSDEVGTPAASVGAAISSITIIQPPATSSDEVVSNTNYIINQILDNIHADEVRLIISTTTSEITITTNAIETGDQEPEIIETDEGVAAIGNNIEINDEQQETEDAQLENVGEPQQATSSPTSFWWKKYNLFFASDEVDSVQVTSDAWQATSMLEIAQNTETQTGASGTGQEITTSTSLLESPIAATEGFLKVSYTLDGVDWQALGMVNKNNWQNINFQIPVYQLEDIKKIQIKIESLPILNETPFVYLDGMALGVEYETSQTLQSKTASVSSQLLSPNVFYNSYSRTPSGSSVTGPVSISVSVDSFEDFGFGNGCGLNSQSCDFWGVRATYFDNDHFNSECVSNEILSHTFAFDLPAGSYIEIMAYAGHTQESCERGGEMSKFLEGDSLKKIFTVTEQ